MIEEVKLIDGSSRSVRFRAPKQSECLSYSLAMAGNSADLSALVDGADGDEIDLAGLLRVRSAMHGEAIAFVVSHVDDASLDADWWDTEVHHEEAIRAASALLASRSPRPAAVGK